TDEQYHTPMMDFVEYAMKRIPDRSVVLFRFTKDCDVHQEPVYNTDVCWPDDARVIRAQDLGARDGELLRYYALRQPDRTYFLFDRATGSVVPLGNAVQAAKLLYVPLDLSQQATADIR
ncbi:MAG TPA: hypothetical protein VN541_21615, partial [Tepidisphaeraceae bacterium]|nr:hypothetical protein [Tepidisphaeraceae bacterium]